VGGNIKKSLYIRKKVPRAFLKKGGERQQSHTEEASRIRQNIVGAKSESEEREGQSGQRNPIKEALGLYGGWGFHEGFATGNPFDGRGRGLGGPRQEKKRESLKPDYTKRKRGP